jgi:polyisoprenyl-phosphate glycosyltransferase
MSLISVIIPVFNEEENIYPLIERLDAISKLSPHDFEFIFIDDCSFDNTLTCLKQIVVKDARVRVIRFSRNFGSHAACLAGLMNSSGDACVFISADMQEPPDLIGNFLKQWQNGYEVVIGVRESDNTPSSPLVALYYFLVRKFALSNMPERGTDVFLIDRKVVDSITGMHERNTSIFGLILWSGFRQVFVQYKRERRQKGISKWTFGKKIKLFIDTFVSFSFFPIRVISVVGIIVAMSGFLYAIVVIYNRLFLSEAIEGWSSLMVVLLLVSGIQLLMLGVLGEYLWRTFDESRKRPPFIISETIGFTKRTM